MASCYTLKKSTKSVRSSTVSCDSAVPELALVTQVKHENMVGCGSDGKPQSASHLAGRICSGACVCVSSLLLRF